MTVNELIFTIFKYFKINFKQNLSLISRKSNKFLVIDR
jgi:hypothetical protein